MKIISDANAGSDDDDDENSDAVPTDSNRLTDVPDELIASLIKVF